MRFVIAQIFAFAFLFIVLFLLARIIMGFVFIPSDTITSHLGDSLKMLSYGLYSDVRIITNAFIPLLVCALLCLLYAFVDSIWGGGGKFKKIVKRMYLYISSFYLGLAGFIFTLFCFISFYYYQMYKTNIDIFIFGLQDDETSAILDIVFKDYPVILLTLIALLFAGFCVWLNTKILRLNIPKPNLKKVTTAVVFIIFVALYILALRGPFRYVAMNDATYRFSNIEVFNAIALNPVMSFVWARKHYKRDTLGIFPPADKDKILSLEKKLFPLKSKSPKNEFALANKPHVMLNLMEGFGLQMLEYTEGKNFLGALQKHFKEDFLFTRFLSFGNNTPPSLLSLVTYSPKVLLKSKYKKYYLPNSPIETYKSQGYKVVFLTSGNAAWYDVGEFMLTQGVDEIIDEVVLSKEYEGVDDTRFAYGIGDEFMYKKALELLENETKPLLILALTVTNHSPFPKVYESFSKEEIPEFYFKSITNRPYKAVNSYIYANNEFGKFLSAFKESGAKDTTIIAATGDHRVRELGIASIEENAFAYSVPLYLYVPKKYQQNIMYDSKRVGSHKDIFPTLYALSLSEVEYLNLGGRNILGPKENEKFEFGYNQAVWIDEKGFYQPHSNIGHKYKNEETLWGNGETFELDSYRLNFAQYYDELNEEQLRYRLINLGNKQ